MSQEKKIDSYVKEIEGTLDVRKAISLFKLMKKKCPEHIKLWSENALEFLEKARITDSNGCEIMQIKKKKKNNSFFSKYEKQIRWIMNIILFATTANFVFMISKYGLKEITPFLSNTCLFTMSCIVLSTNEKK